MSTATDLGLQRHLTAALQQTFKMSFNFCSNWTIYPLANIKIQHKKSNISLLSPSRTCALLLWNLSLVRAAVAAATALFLWPNRLTITVASSLLQSLWCTRPRTRINSSVQLPTEVLATCSNHRELQPKFMEKFATKNSHKQSQNFF